jgi:hypothetical protein
MPPDPSISDVTARIERAIQTALGDVAQEEYWVHHYGANDIHPRNLVYWIVVQSDAEKQRLEQDTALMAKLRRLLDLHEYPAEGRDEVHIGFESQETVDRESGGNFYHHWK